MWCQPSPPLVVEPSGIDCHSRPLTPSSSHRDHDELLISSMQTSVAGSPADSDNNTNKSYSSVALIDFNNPTMLRITPSPTATTPSPPPQALLQKAQQLELCPKNAIPVIESDNNDNKQSAGAAAIAQAKASGGGPSLTPSPTPTSGVSVIGIEETASLITGERWDLTRTPTPTFRQPTPPMPHRPPSPPDQIPSIYLEGPMRTRGQEFVVKEAQIEVEGGDDYDFDDEYEPSGPVILSGKVTLSVISSCASPLPPHDEITEAPSLSLDDRAQADRSKTGGSRKNVAEEIATVCQVKYLMKSLECVRLSILIGRIDLSHVWSESHKRYLSRTTKNLVNH